MLTPQNSVLPLAATPLPTAHRVPLPFGAASVAEGFAASVRPSNWFEQALLSFPAVAAA